MIKSFQRDFARVVIENENALLLRFPLGTFEMSHWLSRSPNVGHYDVDLVTLSDLLWAEEVE